MKSVNLGLGSQLIRRRFYLPTGKFCDLKYQCLRGFDETSRLTLSTSSSIKTSILLVEPSSSKVFTPWAYKAPEEIMFGICDKRTDVYSFACLVYAASFLFYMLSNKTLILVNSFMSRAIPSDSCNTCIFADSSGSLTEGICNFWHLQMECPNAYSIS